MSRHIDYAFKSYVLDKHQDLVVKQRKASLLDYAIDKYNKTGEINHVLRHNNGNGITNTELFSNCLNEGLLNEYNEARKINAASFKRTKRLKDKISSMVSNHNCLFLTLTFNDKCLYSTLPKQRRMLVSRFLKSCNCEYVANIDFGALNGREHYHAVITNNNINLKGWNLKYGAIKYEYVRNSSNGVSSVKLAKYIGKLTNHAIKTTTKRNSIMYSR